MTAEQNCSMPGEIHAQAHFYCSLCGKGAGQVQLIGAPSSCEIIRSSFTSRLTAPVPPEQFPGLLVAIQQQDARSLYALNFEYTPFFCPQCDATYCSEHWQIWKVFDEDHLDWLDSLRGRCPQNHERMLED